MVNSLNEIQIKSSSGNYNVTFFDEISDIKCDPEIISESDSIYVIDKKVYELYYPKINSLFTLGKVCLVDATEQSKSLENMAFYASKILQLGLRKSTRLVAIGGGITQDVCSFLAMTLYRGIRWDFLPTTLLAQADSCIGSKNSINCSSYKNVLGGFWPPRQIVIVSEFLRSLSESDIKSGIGEIYKAHLIAGYSEFGYATVKCTKEGINQSVLCDAIRSSLLIKKKFVEQDEFDRNERRVFNYGHSFGHAIETCTDFQVPHGIAVAAGMAIANKIARELGRVTENRELEINKFLETLYAEHLLLLGQVSSESIVSAMEQDKKNSLNSIVTILPNEDFEAIGEVRVEHRHELVTLVKMALAELGP